MKDQLSTSALAKQLELPSAQLFGTLRDAGWIKKTDEGWLLTAKGEFEGGQYIKSERYGRYIVWPKSLVEHSLIRSLESSKLLSAVALGETWQLSGKTVNRALAELGWLDRGFHGWLLTDAGRKLGGVQLENKRTDMQYVMWPEALAENKALQSLLETCRNVGSTSTDLFSSGECRSLDNHVHSDHARLQICQWLYLAGIHHACDRRLPVEEDHTADFYLPLNRIYIDYWGGDDEADDLPARMRRQDAYKKIGATVIDVHQEDLGQLDDVLAPQLAKLGVNYL